MSKTSIRERHTWMTLAAPSVMASGQVYSPEEGENKNNLLIWYTRLQYTHTTQYHMQKPPHECHNTEKRQTLHE